ncbi:mitochondrial branched-chain alpha-ketoacid dehydrogenase kinase-domain-containing protein [Zopfochytrium polystomum]|nr:mitochondrial branched-chain alpha-ketoacid dehydrogenase kinase-domain-containing protein [Zopfochytrium polystomum]
MIPCRAPKCFPTSSTRVVVPQAILSTASPGPLPQWVYERIDEYAKRSIRQIAFSDMLKFGHRPSHSALLKAALFLADELPVRMAQRFQSLKHMPFGLASLSEVVTVQGWYAKSFAQLIEFREEVERWRRNPDAILKGHNAGAPQSKGGSYIWGSKRVSANAGGGGWFSGPFGGKPVAPTPSSVSNDYLSFVPGDFGFNRERDYELEPHLIAAAQYFNDSFVNILLEIVERHNSIVLLVAKNIRSVGDKHGFRESDPSTQHFLDRFHRTRISQRLLIGHHVALSQPSKSTGANNIGVVDTETNPVEVAEEAAEDASIVCEAAYGASPPIHISLGPSLKKVPTFVFVPSHLHHIMFEILKNAMRASVEKAELSTRRDGRGLDADDLSPVNVSIEEENEGKAILVRVSDRGIGISTSNMPKVFQYSFTTANADAGMMLGSESGASPLAGYGYGLPLSRLYARYFNGDLTLTSKEGYGTDVYLTLPKSLDGVMEPFL